MHQMVESIRLLQASILILRLVSIGDSIASEGKGEYLYVEGRVLDTSGKPVSNASIETWETDSDGAVLYSMLCPHC